MNKKIYLAIPYTGIEDLSYKSANYVAGILINKGYYVFSPISQGHSISNEIKNDKNLSIDYNLWMKQDEEFVKWCDELYVIELIGNEINNEGYGMIMRSKGVQLEIEWAKNLNKPMKIIKFNTENKTIEI